MLSRGIVKRDEGDEAGEQEGQLGGRQAGSIDRVLRLGAQTSPLGMRSDPERSKLERCRSTLHTSR